MNTFLLKIKDPEQVALFQNLTKMLGIEMIAQEDTVLEQNGKDPKPKKYYEEKSHYSPEDIEAIVVQFPADKKWTFSDLQDEHIFPETNIRKQLIDNKLYIMPNPTRLHQKIMLKAGKYIDAFVEENNLGDVYPAPVSVKIDDNTVLEPDVLFISFQKLKKLNTETIDVPPELVLEVISPANYKKLREEKKAKYAQFGVEEYWEIYPKKKLVKIETLVENKDTQEKEYKIYSQATETGKVISKVLEGFELDIEKIFR